MKDRSLIVILALVALVFNAALVVLGTPLLEKMVLANEESMIQMCTEEMIDTMEAEEAAIGVVRVPETSGNVFKVYVQNVKSGSPDEGKEEVFQCNVAWNGLFGKTGIKLMKL